MNKSVIIIGTGGHGKVIADIVLSSGDQVLGFLDDDPRGAQCLGFPVLGRVEDYLRFPDAEFVIGIGNAAVRHAVAAAMHEAKWYTAIHPAAVISPRETFVGEGSVIMAGAVINPCTQIGKHCIINTSASADHDCRLEDFVHIAVGAHLAGGVTVGARTWVGIGAVISNHLSVCADCMLGAGTVVVRDITEAGTYMGVPARRAH